jgi:hypothetical protein
VCVRGCDPHLTRVHCLCVSQSAAASSYDTQQPSLEQADPEMYDLLQHEQTRQYKGLELIASEVSPVRRQPAVRALATWHDFWAAKSESAPPLSPQRQRTRNGAQ